VESALQENSQWGKKLGDEDTFRFDCHKGLSCFGKCCHLEIRLTPYDILKISSLLSLTTAKLLHDLAFFRADHEVGFPVVILKPGKKGRCQFLRSYGCAVYEARPGACRSFPLSRGVSWEDGSSSYYLQELPAYCRGGEESRVWTVVQWREASGLEPYGRWNDAFVLLLSRVRELAVVNIARRSLDELVNTLYDFRNDTSDQELQTDDETMERVFENANRLLDEIRRE